MPTKRSGAGSPPVARTRGATGETDGTRVTGTRQGSVAAPATASSRMPAPTCGDDGRNRKAPAEASAIAAYVVIARAAFERAISSTGGWPKIAHSRAAAAANH